MAMLNNQREKNNESPYVTMFSLPFRAQIIFWIQHVGEIPIRLLISPDNHHIL